MFQPLPSHDLEPRRRHRTVRVPLAYLQSPTREELPHIDKDAAAVLLDNLLLRVAQHESQCRLRIGRIAARLLESKAHHRLGFARVGDYAIERLGLSARELQSTARVWRAVETVPALSQAFRSGRLNWTKLRIICEVADSASAEHWISLAQQMTSRELEAHIKEAPRAESGGAGRPSSDAVSAESGPSPLFTDADNGDDPELVDGEPRAELRIRCPARVRSLWRDVAELASRSAGSLLAGWQVLDAVCGEAASGPMLGDGDIKNLEALRPLDSIVRVPGSEPQRRRNTRPAGWDGELEVLRALIEGNTGLDLDETLDRFGPAASAVDQFDPHAGDTAQFDDALEQLDAEQLDEALRAVLDSSRNIDWQLGRLLATFSRLNLHRHVGYASHSVYVRERLGLSPRKASSLVRIEGNPTQGRAELAEAYRAGRISWVRTVALLAVVSPRHATAWIERAEQVTVRRLFDEIRWALDMRDRAWLFIELIPPPLGAKLVFSDAEADRQMRAHYDADLVERIKQHPPEDTTYLILSGPMSLIELFHDVLQAHRDPQTPWEPTWKALERLLLLVKAHWSDVPRHRNPIHERDGWRCRVPGCSSRRNLQEHHVLYRSRGGDNARGNRISICAWHHLRGIHGGLVRAHGDAERGIHWQLGRELRLVDEVYEG